MSDTPRRFGFVLFPELTQLDLTGPWEVLTRLPGVACHLLARDLAPVRSASGLSILPTATFDDCRHLDLVCVPGGPGHVAAMEDAALIGFLRRVAPGCAHVTAVCTGALVLAAACLLAGRRATTHWMSLDRLAVFGAVPVAERVVFDGPIVTGGGVTAGIDFALVLAAVLAGEDVARAIALQMEYAPAPPHGPGTPDAMPDMAARLRERAALYLARMAEVDARLAPRPHPAHITGALPP